MKRRGFLAKLGLGIAAAPAVAKAVVDKPDYTSSGVQIVKNEIPSGWQESPSQAFLRNRSAQGSLRSGKDVFKQWDAAARYEVGDIITAPNGEKVRISSAS